MIARETPAAARADHPTTGAGAPRPADPVGTPAPLLTPLTAPQRAFLLTQHLPQPSPPELLTVEHALHLACSRLSEAGTPVQVVATSYVAAQQRWLGLCLADDARDVLRAAATAQLTGVDVTEV